MTINRWELLKLVNSSDITIAALATEILTLRADLGDRERVRRVRQLVADAKARRQPYVEVARLDTALDGTIDV